MQPITRQASGTAKSCAFGALRFAPAAPHFHVKQHMQKMRRFDLSFARLVGKPCWGVKRGFGSFLTMEFGEPHLEVREARVSNAESKKVRDLMARRMVTVRGEWHLWIYCCDWSVFDDSGKLVGDTSSKRAIDRAAKYLDGQALVASALIPRGMRTVWEFDQGATLKTKPFNREDRQWMLYEPEGKVLALRADKHYCYGPGNREPDKERWLPIKERRRDP